jgi:hypothetical protein
MRLDLGKVRLKLQGSSSGADLFASPASPAAIRRADFYKNGRLKNIFIFI